MTIRIGETIPFEQSEPDPRAVFQTLEETIRGGVEEIRGRV